MQAPKPYRSRLPIVEEGSNAHVLAKLEELEGALFAVIDRVTKLEMRKPLSNSEG